MNTSTENAYDGHGRRSAMNRALDHTTKYEYTPEGLLQGVFNYNNARDEINHFEYEYDPAGRRTSMSTRDFDVSYGFDDLDRIDISHYSFIATSTVTPAMQPDDDFGYDANGNRLSSAADPAYDDAYSPRFDNLNRLLEDGNWVYKYDHNGNTIAKFRKHAPPSERWYYNYNFKNQLMRASLYTGDPNYVLDKEVHFRYDPMGRRIARGVKSNVSGTLQWTSIDKFIYDGDDVRFEFLADDSSGGKSFLNARYTHGPGIDEPLIFWKDLDPFDVDNTLQPYFYHFDGLGSVTAMTDRQGEIVAKYVYDVFGNAVQRCGPLAALNRYMFTAREYDALVQLYFNRSRYYDPINGSFREEDPKWDPNLYKYTSNNPISFTDAFGNIKDTRSYDDGYSANLSVDTQFDWMVESYKEYWNSKELISFTLTGINWEHNLGAWLGIKGKYGCLDMADLTLAAIEKPFRHGFSHKDWNVAYYRVSGHSAIAVWRIDSKYNSRHNAFVFDPWFDHYPEVYPWHYWPSISKWWRTPIGWSDK